MTRDARELQKAFDLLYEACLNIQDHGGCENCPISHLCLNNPSQSVMEIAELMSASSWDEFLEYADNVTFSEEDVRAQYADLARKIDIEEREIE